MRSEPLHIASTHGVQVTVHDLGGEGPPALLAHATGFHGLVWRPFAAALDGRHCYAPDLRGHGSTVIGEVGHIDWDGFADDVLSVVDALGLDAPVGIGHSKGAAALLRAEVRRPGTFSALWCYEPIVFPPPARRAETNPLAEGALRRRPAFGSRDEAFTNYANKPPMKDFDPDALAAYVEHGFVDAPDGTVELACRPEVEAEIYRGGSAHDTFEHLGEVRCPVVVACGNDGMPALIAPKVADAIRDGRLHRFDSLGHFGPLEAPARTAADVSEFLASCGR